MGTVKVKILPDPLINKLGFQESVISLEPGTYKFGELVRILVEKIEGLEEILNTKTLNKEIFIAVDDWLPYDLDRPVNIKDGSKISIFTVGAGG